MGNEDVKNYRIRKLKLTEAEKVVSCIYNTYGDSYMQKDFYDKDTIEKLNRERTMISYVAVNDKEEIKGHIALVPSKELQSSELAVAFVHTDYRGNGCLNALAKVAIEKSKKRGDVGCYVHAVTSHIYSQRVAEKQGFQECALLIYRLPFLEFKNIQYENTERESLLIAYQYFEEEQEKKVFYVSKQHREIVKEIYENLNVTVVFKSNNKDRVEEKNNGHIEIMKDEYEAAVITSMGCGEKLKSKISSALKTLVKEKRKAIFLKMKMSEKSTIEASEIAEKLGFFFSGVMPGTFGKDEIIFQYINEEIQYENIILNSKMSKKLFEHMRRCLSIRDKERRKSI